MKIFKKKRPANVVRVNSARLCASCLSSPCLGDRANKTLSCYLLYLIYGPVAATAGIDLHVINFDPLIWLLGLTMTKGLCLFFSLESVRNIMHRIN